MFLDRCETDNSNGTVWLCAVSTTDQDLTVQEASLTAAGCAIIRTEKKSGTSRRGRTELDVLLEFLRAGDTLIVTRIDRLARSIGDLQDIVRAIAAKGAMLRATEQLIDTSTAAGKAFLDMLRVFAEFETNLRKERQLEGIVAAKVRGVYAGNGRLPTIDPMAVRRLRDAGVGPAAIAKQLNIGRASVYRLMRTDDATNSPSAVEPDVLSSAQELAA